MENIINSNETEDLTINAMVEGVDVNYITDAAVDEIKFEYKRIEDKILIEIGEDKLPKIKIINSSGTETKYVSLSDLAAMFASASELDNSQEEVYMESPLLPQFNGISTVQYLESESTQIYILRKEACKMDLTYFGDAFSNVGIPTLLFKIKVSNDSIKGVEVVAIKEPVISKTTMLYRYPFSNVFDTTKMCLGANNIAGLDVAQTSTIYRIPNLVLSLDNNNDAYRNSNSSSLELRELFAKLSGKKFDQEILVQLKINDEKFLTYEKWVNKNR